MRCLIAAGGTGGHVFPALSVAMALRESDRDAEVLFVGTGRGLESREVPARGFPLRIVRAYGIMGLGWWAKLRTLMGLPWTAVQCLLILSSFRPALVVGMGGFASGPMVMLAATLGIPTAIAEQNAVAGRTNRFLGRVVRRVFVTYPESAEGFRQDKVFVTGNPVRPELAKRAEEPRSPQWVAREGQEFHLLVFGGSQGALGINLVVMEALPLLRSFAFPLRVIHQAAQSQVAQLREAYAASQIDHDVVAFIDDMAQAYRWAHLVVCRSGATSLAEIALFRVPSILIPFPYAVDDHQTKNARIFESSEAAILIQQGDLSGEKLAGLLTDLAGDPQRLGAMGERAGALARPEAAQLIVDECLRLVRGEASLV